MKHVMIPLQAHAFARQFLREEQHYEILKDNFSRAMDEIDFIAFEEHESAIVFIELRYCESIATAYENPRERFNKRRFERLALAFLSKYPCLATYDIRADQLNIVELADGRTLIHYYRNVASIEFS